MSVREIVFVATREDRDSGNEWVDLSTIAYGRKEADDNVLDVRSREWERRNPAIAVEECVLINRRDYEKEKARKG